MKRLVGMASLTGIVLPAAWMLIYHVSPSFSQWWLRAPEWMENVRLVLWPSAMLLIADPLDENVSLWIISALLNGALYGLVAWLIVRSIATGR